MVYCLYWYAYQIIEYRIVHYLLNISTKPHCITSYISSGQTGDWLWILAQIYTCTMYMMMIIYVTAFTQQHLQDENKYVHVGYMSISFNQKQICFWFQCITLVILELRYVLLSVILMVNEMPTRPSCPVIPVLHVLSMWLWWHWDNPNTCICQPHNIARITTGTLTPTDTVIGFDRDKCDHTQTIPRFHTLRGYLLTTIK